MKLRALGLFLGLLLVGAPQLARAQEEAPTAPAPQCEPPPQYDPPPQYYPPAQPYVVVPAQPYVVPPQYYPPPQLYVVPPPNVAPARYVVRVDPVELERRGRHKKIAGAVMMGLGAALTIAGLGLAIDAAVNGNIECHGHEEHTTCTPSPALTQAQTGDVAIALGQLVMVAGIPVYVVGSVQAARARKLSTQLGLQPLVSQAGGGGAVATAAFRF